MIACMDSSVLIQCVSTREEDQPLRHAALDWVREVERMDGTIMIPPHVKSELLSVMDKDLDDMVELLEDINYRVPAFDERCANVSAMIWREMAKHQTMPRGKKKRTVKSDIHIAATAMVYRAHVIVTFDNDFLGANNDGKQGIRAALLRMKANIRIEEPRPQQSILRLEDM